MPAYTQNDLVTAALERLGEVGFGQAQEPEARERVVRSLPGILAELREDGVYDFAGSAEVPPAAYDPLSAIIASRLSDRFGLPQDETVILAQREQGAIERLRRYRALPYVHVPARPDYF